MNDWLKPNQEEKIIKNCVESIMEDLDDYYFDELFMKQYKKRLIEFFTKISKEYSLFEAGFDFSNKKNLEKSTKPMASWADIPEYKKILKEVAEDFISLVETEDYEEFENITKLKKEITEHFDKFFKDPEFDRLMSKAND
jgi:vacuolar-type H+-ATPase catalytic subunit A/Vma1